MDVTSRRAKKKTKAVPYNSHEAKVEKKAIASTKKSVKPVGKDTNKTRRKIVKPGVLKTTHR